MVGDRTVRDSIVVQLAGVPVQLFNSVAVECLSGDLEEGFSQEGYPGGLRELERVTRTWEGRRRYIRWCNVKEYQDDVKYLYKSCFAPGPRR